MVEVYSLNLSEQDIENKTYFDMLRNRIKELGLNSRELLFRGFDGANLETLLSEGTDELDREFIYAANSSMKEESGDMDVFEFALYFDKPCIAVYDRDKFHKDEYCYVDDFVFNDLDNKLDSLLAVFRIDVKSLEEKREVKK